MKKKFFSCLLLVVFACIALFSFAACDNGSTYDDSALIERIEALEDEIKNQQDTIKEQGETIKNQQDTIKEQGEMIKNQAATITALQKSITELQTAKAKLEEQISTLENDNTANKTEITTLKTKVEALEAANANFQQQIDALDTSSDTFAENLAELTSNYENLTASVQNATHIERVVVKEEDIGSNKIISSIPLIILDINNGRLVVGCSIIISTSLFPYQIITCKTDITYNDQIHDVDIFLSKSDIQGSSSASISESTFTDILLSDTTNVSSKFDELVLYRFT